MSKKEQFAQLTWADIVDWAGAAVASRGKSYQRNGKVEKLALSPAGAVVAWVQGTEKYATLVDLADDELTSDCTCLYGGICKHAVAVALEYMENLEKNIEVPAISHGDARLGLLGNPDEAMTDEEQDEGTEEAADRPLPETGLPEDVRAGRSDFPLTDVLIDIAMAEKRPDEVLRWYDRKKPGPAWDYLQPWSREDKVAGAIAEAYPDRAVAI